MAGFYDIWRVWWKGPSGDYVELGTLYSRNVVGNAFISATANLYAFAHPVVLRFTVISRNGSQATLSRKICLPTDVNYAGESESITVETGVAVTTLFLGANVTVSAAAAQGDIFEVGEGYSWDSANARWISQRAFGVIPSGSFGSIHTMKAQNIAARARIYVAVGWTSNGTGILQARLPEGTWQNAQESPIAVAGDDGLSGYVGPNEYFEVEFRPFVPAGTSAEDNPLDINVWINGEEV